MEIIAAITECSVGRCQVGFQVFHTLQDLTKNCNISFHLLSMDNFLTSSQTSPSRAYSSKRKTRHNAWLRHVEIVRIVCRNGITENRVHLTHHQEADISQTSCRREETFTA